MAWGWQGPTRVRQRRLRLSRGQSVMASGSLYKYRSLAGACREHAEALLRHSELYFAAPSSFDDPFDCQGRFAALRESADRGLEALLPLVDELRPDWDEEARRRSVEGILGLRGEPDAELAAAIAADLQRDVERTGVFSLTEDPASLLMWAHYADGHRGFCVELSRQGEPFRSARPVEYSPRYLDVALLDPRPGFVTKTLLTKARPWSYEKEWRLVLEPDRGPGTQRFPPELLVGVILGHRMPPEHRRLVGSWVRQRRPRPRLFEARPKAAEFGLEIVPLAAFA